MKDRILYFIQSFYDLGIVNSIQEKLDCDLYALIDFNKYIKKIYQEQQLVKFQKTWFYRDHILKLNRKPDLEYLSSFEKKYGINLWLIAYMDRNFYQYNNYYKFSPDEILLIFEQECKLYEKILDEVNPDFVIIHVPDYNLSELLFELCRARKIKILTLNLSKLGNTSIISEQTGRIDYFEKIIDNYSNRQDKTFEEIQNYTKLSSQQNANVKNEYRSSLMKKLKGSIRYLLVVCNNEYRKYYVNYGRTRLRVLINESLTVFKNFYRTRFLNKNLILEINKNIPFVYFPLHFEPERSTLMDAPFYNDQLHVIRNIAKSLPVEYMLYVKEHPVQVLNGWRSISFYKTILEMPNVKLLHPAVSNEEILKNCSLVITITGTLGLEAAFYKKPTITLADVIYSGLPSVYRLKSFEDLPQALRLSLNKEVNLSDLNKFVNCLIDNSFEYDMTKLDIEIQNRFFYGGFLFDVEVPTQQAISFMQEFKPTFDKLASEYVRKINQHKKFQNKTIN